MGVGAVDDNAGDAVSDGAVGEVFAGELEVDRGGVGPEVVFDHEDDAEFLHGGEVEAFVGGAGGLAAVADVGEAGDVLALDAGAEGDAAHHGDGVAEVGDGGDDVEFFGVTVMGAGFAAAGGGAALGHVLHEGVAGLESP